LHRHDRLARSRVGDVDGDQLDRRALAARDDSHDLLHVTHLTFARLPSRVPELAAGCECEAGGRMGRVEVFESELATRSPFDGHGLLAFLRPRAIAGVEAATDDRYVRVVTLPHGPGVMELRPDGDRVAARFELSDPTDLDEGVRRARHLLDLDTDPEPVDALLAQDPY